MLTVGDNVGECLMRLQETTKSWTWTTKITDRLQKTTKVGMRLQRLLIDYQRLQKLDLEYKDY